MSFFSHLSELAKSRNSLLCVGLDPHPDKLATADANHARDACLELIESTHKYAIAYKPNIAFFEIYGAEGLSALKEVVGAVPDVLPVILDAKRGDIGSTSRAYAKAIFETLATNAVTVNAYLGFDAIQPFIQDSEKGVFILCKTSNPSSGDLQDSLLQDGKTVYSHMANLAREWNTKDNIGLVIGATYPQTLAEIRAQNPGMWFLTPGIGAQGGDIKVALHAGLRQDGSGMLVPVSRGIANADDPGRAAIELRDEINRARENRPAMPASSGDHEKLAAGLLEAGCVKFGDFTLKSGIQSPIYIDLRLLSGEPALLNLAARAYASRIAGLNVERLAGIPYAALPLATAISLQTGIPLIYPRKEVKEYGTRAAVEGPYNAGDRVVMIEDLVSTGASTLEAIDKLEAVGLTIKNIAVLIDRRTPHDQRLEEQGLDLHAVFTLPRLLQIWQEMGRISADQVEQVEAFLKQ